jgi:hypothetical protein
MQQNNEFCAALKEYGSAKGLQVISQQDILDAIGLQELTLEFSDKTKGHDVDGLSSDLNKKIYDLFLELPTIQNKD